MGYAGRNSETESAHPVGIKERRSATVDCYVWLVVPLHRRNSREDLRQRRFSVLNFLRVRLRVQQRSENQSSCASHSGFVVRFCAYLLRSSSAYVPSACQAGPHAHPL